MVQGATFVAGVPPDLYAFHRYTGNSTPLSHTRSTAVFDGPSRLSREISHQTHCAAYALFTPSNSEQRWPPTYYRGCWHVVSRGFFCRYRLISSLPKELYTPKSFITHAASLHQGFPHCARFPTAASRRSLDRVSVPVWPCVLSDRLLIKALVGHYPAN